jgi:WS/DGAT/MGAT family acyltransferase
MTRHRMDPGDIAWLHMDRSTNLMVVTSVMWFDEPIDRDLVTDLVRTRLVERYPRFTQKVVDDHGVWWEDDERFDLNQHITHVTLPEPGTREQLQEFVGDLQHQPLSFDHPLWHMYLIDGYGGHGSAVVSRIHHCVADGIALSRVFLSLTDDEVQAARADVAPPAASHAKHGLVPTVMHLTGSLASDAVHPSRLVHLAKEVLADGKAAAKLVLLPPDAHTDLRGHTGERKSTTWADPIPLIDLKRAAHGAGVTVNDLLMTALSGALRSHQLHAGSDHPVDVRAIVPVNLRPLDQPLPAELGNRFGLIFLTLPVSIADPVDRMAEVVKRMAAIKHSAEPAVSFGILDLVGHTSRPVEQAFVDLFANKGTAVVTNVPGPTHALFLAGRKVRGTIGWPPESGNIGLGVSIISYDGEVTVGLLSDNRLVPDPRGLLDDVNAGMHELIELCVRRAEPVAH